MKHYTLDEALVFLDAAQRIDRERARERVILARAAMADEKGFQSVMKNLES